MKSPLSHLLAALAVCAVILAGYGAAYAAVAAESASVAALESQIGAATATANRIASARAALAEIAGDEAAVQAYFVPESAIVAFINALEERGRAQGASVSVASVSAQTVKAHPMLALALTVTGTFGAVMRTVGSVEYAPYDLAISTLSVGQDAKSGWRADLTLSVGSALSAATTTLAAPGAVAPAR